MSAVLDRNNVRESGAPDGRPMLFLHGFGCDQHVWRFVAPEFADRFQTVLMDHVGAGGSDTAAYEPAKYSTLAGYARDVVEVARALDLRDAVLVGHSVGATIAALAAIEAPELVGDLVLVGPSARYIDDDGYVGGFSAADIASLLESLEQDYVGWARQLAPLIMGNPERPELGEELTDSFCRTDPEIARHFARVTFTSDNRGDLTRVSSRALVLQCTDDPIAPEAAGWYVAATIPESQFVHLRATGHCPHLSAPDEVICAVRAFLSAR